jgi:sphinganine-1-phosphate aldolase
LKKLSDIEIIGEPLLSVIAFTSKNPKLNIYSLGEYLDKKEWHLNVLQRPPSIHIACTLLTTSGVESFLEDLKAGISNVLSDPNSKGGDKAAIYGAAASIPDPAVVEDVVFGFLDALTLVET